MAPWEIAAGMTKLNRQWLRQARQESLASLTHQNGALVTQGVQHFLFVERSPGVLARRRVELLLQDREYCWLASGVEPGERIVTTGALLLQSELAAAP